MEDYKKKYEEALKRIKECVPDDNGFITIYPQEIFPELKESEDERIRKALIRYFTLSDEHAYDEACGVSYRDIVAWLEAQGKQKSLDDVAKEITRNKETATSFLKSCGIMNANGELADEYKIEQDEQKFEEVDNLHNYLYGKQKPADKIEPKFKIGQTIVYKGTENIAPTKMTISDIVKGQYWDDNCCIVPISDQDNWELVEQKSNNKVEPKFKVKDWIVDEDNNCVYQIKRVIENVTRGVFSYDLVGGGYFPSTKKNCHIWTIQDAKDGDVLAVEPIEGYSSSFVAIYKKQNEEDFDSYCFVGFDGKFYDGENGHSAENIHPATKEQLDTLMKAMADAGYEWDAEKKELKKIKQKLAWSEEYGKLINRIEGWLDTLCDYLKDSSPECIEDVKDIVEQLKSLRPLLQWKPSDEQMKTLNEVLNFAANHESPHWNDYIFGTLNNLIRQLKKLKE